MNVTSRRRATVNVGISVWALGVGLAFAAGAQSRPQTRPEATLHPAAAAARDAAIAAREQAQTAPEAPGRLRVLFDDAPGVDHPAENSILQKKQTEVGDWETGETHVVQSQKVAFVVLCMTEGHEHPEPQVKFGNIEGGGMVFFAEDSKQSEMLGDEVIYLDHPDSYEFELAPGRHNLLLGVGRSIDESWTLAFSRARRVNVRSGQTGDIGVRLRTEPRVTMGQFCPKYDFQLVPPPRAAR